MSTATAATSSTNRPPSKSAALSKVFNSPPVYDIIFSHCMGTTSPARLSRVHGGARSAFQNYMTRSWHKRLLRYFLDPRAFRSLQARTGFLVSGSQPLQAFMGEDYGISSDVDIYPWPGTEREIGNWLVEQGYRLQDAGDDSFAAVMDEVERVGWADASVSFPCIGCMGQYSGCDSVDGLLVFEKDLPDQAGTQSNEDGVNQRPLQVQVVVSKISPVATILDFHSTPVMNIFTWNRAYSLFPRTNFDSHRMCILRQDDALDYEIISKYEQRGFESSNDFPLDSHPSAIVLDKTSRRMTRWVGDKFTWTVDLDVAGIVPHATPEVDLTLNGFTVVLPNESEHGDGEGRRERASNTPASSGSESDSESDSDSHMSWESSEAETIVTIVHAVLPRKAGLSVPYTVPDDFVATLKELVTASKAIPPRHRGIFFDPSDRVSRDGILRQYKAAYERHHSGEISRRLLFYVLDPPPPPTFEEYMEDYEYYEEGRSAF